MSIFQVDSTKINFRIRLFHSFLLLFLLFANFLNQVFIPWSQSDSKVSLDLQDSSKYHGQF